MEKIGFGKEQLTVLRSILEEEKTSWWFNKILN